MAREIKGLLAGLAAGIIAVGGAYGVSALVTGGQTAPTKTAHKPTTQTASNPAQLVSLGHSLYGQFCANCHGANGEGQRGPSLQRLGDPDAKIARNIANGFPGLMPAYENKLNDAQRQALVAYIQSLE